MTLSQLPIGRRAVITTVGGEGTLRLRLLDLGLIPKTEVTVTRVAPMGDPMELSLRGYVLTLRLEDAAKVEVSPL
jgi:Fe2+ transport system protein A